MKKIIITIFIFLVMGFIQSSYSQNDSNFALLEYCTGTWCGYCPCGHQIIDQIMASYPNTVVVGYHGPVNYGSPVDPFAPNCTAQISLQGYNSYPTGVIGRTTGIISRSAWFSTVAAQSSYAPGVRIEIINPTFNAGTRVLSGTIKITVLTTQTGSFYLNTMLTENHLVAPQNFYASCGTAGIQNDYIHSHVFRAAINGTTGSLLSASGITQGQIFNIPLNYTVPTSYIYSNCDLVNFIYQGGNYLTTSAVQNAKDKPVPSFPVTGISHNEVDASSYELAQNYPNPFNPVTNIKFSIPKDDNVTLKVYDILGSEVTVFLNDVPLKAGSYNAEFIATNLSSGIYFYKLTTNNFSETKKMILSK